MDQPRRRLSAVWFADIVGYTELSSRDEPAAMKLVNALQSAARGAVAEFEGRIVKFIGDAVLAEFSSTESAVRAAVVLQERYEQAARATGQPSELRIGVHLGEVTATPDGDLYGDGINTAARLQHEAAPGKIIISEDGWRQLRQRPEFRFESLGAVELKGISTAVQIYDVVFGARAALAAASATTPVTPQQPAPVTTAAPRRPLSAFAPLGIALLLVVIGAALMLPRLRSPAAAPVVQQPPADTAPSQKADSQPAAQAPEPAAAVAAPPKPAPSAVTTQKAATEKAPAPVNETPAPGDDRQALHDLLDRFATSSSQPDAEAKIRAIYPTMSDMQASNFRQALNELGPGLQTRLGRIEPRLVRGDTLNVDFMVIASTDARPTVPLLFEALVVRSPTGPKFLMLRRAAPRVQQRRR